MEHIYILYIYSIIQKFGVIKVLKNLLFTNNDLNWSGVNHKDLNTVTKDLHFR